MRGPAEHVSVAACAVLVASVLLMGARCGAQSSSRSAQSVQAPQGGTYTSFPDVDGIASANPPAFMERRLRQLNVVQHAAVVADTQRLVKLVTELNAEIAGSNATKLTPEQLRRVAEIEKLARSVRDKMRFSARGAMDPVDQPPASPFGPR